MHSLSMFVPLGLAPAQTLVDNKVTKSNNFSKEESFFPCLPDRRV